MLKKYTHLIIYAITLVALIISVGAVSVAFRQQREQDAQATVDTTEDPVVSAVAGSAGSDYSLSEDTAETLKTLALSIEEEKTENAAAAAELAIQSALEQEAAAKGETSGYQAETYDTESQTEETYYYDSSSYEETEESSYSETEEQYEETTAAETTVAEETTYEEETTAAEETTYEEETTAAAESSDSSSQNTSSDFGLSSGIYSYSSSDINYLVWCVSAEAGSSPYETQLAVANVILDRAADCGSIYSAVYASGQFSVTWNGAIENAMANGPSQTTLQAVQNALNGTDNRSLPYRYFNNVDMGYTGEWIGDQYFYLIN